MKKSLQKIKIIGAWGNEEETEDDAETTNICFMTIEEATEVRSFNYHNFNLLQSNTNMITDDL